MNKKILSVLAALSALSVAFAGCAAAGKEDGAHWPSEPDAPLYDDENHGDGNYVYDGFKEQDFSLVSEKPSSYFSLDRNTAGYSLMRSQINYGTKIMPDSVRIEELINYFDYSYPAPDGAAVNVSTYLSDCPWNDSSKLMLVGLKTTEMNLSGSNANYVFLIDVSGSMSGDSRLGLAKKGLNTLVDNLGENDLVSVVTYANGVKEVLNGEECSENGKAIIKESISSLVAGGGTNGGDGLERAYRIAAEHFITGGNNRVIIISDGDFNVGMSSTEQLKEFIQTKAEHGVYLSVLGVGMYNMRDDVLQTLATCGNGNYAYLDNETEIRKVFTDEINATLKTVAKDAKAGVTFTQSVEKYRLIGYDTKLISEDDFENPDSDAGELGSNLCVSALYEIVPAENAEGKLADVTVKYKDVTGETQTDETATAEVTLETPSSQDLSFISCVAEFGLVLRDSQYRGTAAITAVLQRLDGLGAYTAADEYKNEFVGLVGKASESGFYGGGR